MSEQVFCDDCMDLSSLKHEVEQLRKELEEAKVDINRLIQAVDHVCGERDELQQYKTLYHEWAESSETRLEKNRDELAAYSKKLEYKLADMGVMPVDNKPSTSLQQHDNEVIARCAKECAGQQSIFACVTAIRALKTGEGDE